MLNDIFCFKKIFQENKVWTCLITNWSDDKFPNFFSKKRKNRLYSTFSIYFHTRQQSLGCKNVIPNFFIFSRRVVSYPFVLRFPFLKMNILV